MRIIVKNTEKLEGDYGEYLKVTYDKDGKEQHRNINSKFKGQWGYFAQGRMIELKYRKGEDEKWVLVEIIPASLDSVQQLEPEELQEPPSKPLQSKSTPVKEESNITDKDRHIATLNATTATANIISQGLFPLDRFGELHGKIYRLNTHQLSNDAFDEWMATTLKNLK